MKNRHLFLFALLTLLTIILLSACVRPASTPPKSQSVSGTTTTEFPVPGTTEDVMAQLGSLATQTAMALTGGSAGAQQTPVVTQPAPGTSAPGTSAEVTPAPTTEGQAQPTAAPPTAQPTSQPQAQVVVPTRTPGRPSSYTLKGGEFPYCIARRFDVNPSEMLNMSGLSSGGVFPPGTVLRIPQSGSFPGARSLQNTPDTYTVKSGDTIYAIACLYGKVDPSEIAYANNLSSPYTLKVGQELTIP